MEGNTWTEAYKIVPAMPPWEGYPDYQVGYTYTHQGEVELCTSGFHASPTFVHCKQYVNPTKDCGYLKVRAHNPVWDDGVTKCVSSKLEVISEYSYGEAQRLTQRTMINNNEYYAKGFCYHREDKDADGNALPAVIQANGSKYWYKDGKEHREDKDADGNALPAVIQANGSKYWYKDGELHREDKDADGNVLPAVIQAGGTKYWYKDGKLHREGKDADGNALPAVIWADGAKEWWKDGVLQQSPPPNKATAASQPVGWTKEQTQ